MTTEPTETDLTARVLTTLALDIADLVEITETIRAKFNALAAIHGAPTVEVDAVQPAKGR